MAGHSHASNVKHKKDRNDKLKSETFLKLRKKIEMIIRKEGNYEKVFALARENSFPKEKVNSIIEKINSKQEEDKTFSQMIYSSKFDIVWCLEGFIGEEEKEKIAEVSKLIGFEKINNKSVFEYFEPLYLIRLKTNNNLENLIFSSLSSEIINKINKIEELHDCDLNFEIVFSEKQIRDDAFESLKSNSEIVDFQLENILSSFSSISLNSEESVYYFLESKKKISEMNCDLRIFTNISGEKWDHSSVG